MIVRHRGKTKFVWLPVTPSTVLTAGTFVAWSSGQLVAATSSSPGSNIPGIVRHTILATDDDYGDERLIEVEVAVERCVEWKMDVTSGLVVGDIGGYFDLTDAGTVDRSNTTYDIVQLIKVISTTLGVFFLNIGPDAIAGK